MTSPLFPSLNQLELLTDSELRLLLKNSDCPSEIVEWIRVNTKDYNLSFRAWGHRNLPMSVLVEEVAAIVEAGGQIRYGSWGITNNPNLTTSMLIELSRTGTLVYDHPNFDMTVMLDHYHTVNKDSKKMMAQNPCLSQDMQAKLSTSNVNVRATLARNHNISPTTMAVLAEDSSFHVIRSLLDNPAAEHLKLTLLSRVRGMDTQYSVSRDKVFAKHSMDPDEVRGYCLHPHPKVRKAAVKNPACPEEGLIAAALLDQ